VLWERPCSTEIWSNLRFDRAGLARERATGVLLGCGVAEVKGSLRAAHAVANSTTAAHRTPRSNPHFEGFIHTPVTDQEGHSPPQPPIRGALSARASMKAQTCWLARSGLRAQRPRSQARSPILPHLAARRNRGLTRLVRRPPYHARHCHSCRLLPIDHWMVPWCAEAVAKKWPFVQSRIPQMADALARHLRYTEDRGAVGSSLCLLQQSENA
jgi:hypothetical protein